MVNNAKLNHFEEYLSLLYELLEHFHSNYYLIVRLKYILLTEQPEFVRQKPEEAIKMCQDVLSTLEKLVKSDSWSVKEQRLRSILLTANMNVLKKQKSENVLTAEEYISKVNDLMRLHLSNNKFRWSKVGHCELRDA